VKEEENRLLNRTALHAMSLTIIYPITDKQIILEAPLPKNMGAVLKALRKYAPTR